MLKAGTLYHGGIMVNYQCNAACRHCLYSCSPSRESGYVDEASAAAICRLLGNGGCRSVHIGGGEPFLNFDGLLMMIKNLSTSGIALEYVETNAYWALNASDAQEKLAQLLAAGVHTLCISIDPFHAEHIPYGAPLALAQLCEKTGMGYFLWKQELLPFLSHLEASAVHPLAGDIIEKTARLYGIGYGGRAINIEQEFGGRYPAEHFAAESAPCHNLLSTRHFHVDKNACFIPPRCTGIRIPLAEAAEGIPPGKYPAFEALYHGGLSALLNLARQRGFNPDNTGYPSKCSLCFHIRHFLSGLNYAELDLNHYEEALKRQEPLIRGSCGVFII